MPHFVALSPSRHRDMGWLKVADYLFAEHETLVPLVGEELPHALAIMPMGFRQRETGNFELVAVMSLQAQRNLFVHPDGRWIGGYKPAALRGYPFSLQREQGSDRHVLCFDENSGLMLENPRGDGEPFFDAQGEPAPLVKKLLDFLGQWEQQRQVTQRAVDMLAAQELIVPWEVKVADEASGNTQAVQGLYRLDEKALNALDEKGMAALRAVNALPIAYAQLFSQHRIGVLGKLYRLHAEFEQEDPAKVDIESLFDDGSEDFSFDFDS